jgi:hypothetical protein
MYKYKRRTNRISFYTYVDEMLKYKHTLPREDKD